MEEKLFVEYLWTHIVHTQKCFLKKKRIKNIQKYVKKVKKICDQKKCLSETLK